MSALNKIEKIIKIVYSKSGHVDRQDIQIACGLLNCNGVIAIPTDTLYGLAARVDDSKALERIYKIKGRDPSKPLAVCIAELDQLDQVADVSKFNKNILSALLPGPLTLVFKRSDRLNKDLNPGVGTVGVRLPDHNFSRQIIRELGCPLALTSANRSGETSPLAIDEFQDIWDDLDAVFDLGVLRGSIPAIDSSVSQRMRNGSTVVDLTEERAFKILREGCAYNRIQNVLHRFGFRNKTKR